MALKRNKTAKKKSRLYPKRPIVHGNFDIELEAGDFLPVVTLGSMKPYKIASDKWNSIEKALNTSLDGFHREWIEWACASFIFACAYKSQLPSQDRYIKELLDRAQNVGKLVRVLFRTLHVPIEAGKKVRLASRVTTPFDHLRIVASLEWRDELISLGKLGLRIENLENELKAFPIKKRGRDKHYEIWHFLQSLTYIARSVGDSLKITTRNARGETNNSAYAKTKMVRFSEEIRDLLKTDMEKVLGNYALDPLEHAKAVKTFQLLIEKKWTTLIDDLMKARAFIEGSPRRHT